MPTPEPTHTPTPEPTVAAGWRTDVSIGATVGTRATDATLTLADGSTATIQEVSGGKPLLLYFFATW